MGGIVSNPLDDAKRQEIQDTVEEVMGVFSKEFAMGYKTALIDKIRAENGGALGDVVALVGHHVRRRRVEGRRHDLGLRGPQRARRDPRGASIIAVPISEIVNPMIEEGLEPVQELVPDALSDLINIPRVAITVIDGVRDDALKALVTPALVNELAKIDAAA